jgi:hypothetical protein
LDFNRWDFNARTAWVLKRVIGRCGGLFEMRSREDCAENRLRCFLLIRVTDTSRRMEPDERRLLCGVVVFA